MPKITKIEYRGKLKYVTLDGRKFVIKEKKRYDIDKVYQYLEDHGINHFIKPCEIREKELVFPYIESSLLEKEEKAERLIYVLSLWQNKTTIYKKLDMDLIKENYEEKKRRIAYLFSYYHDLQDAIETHVYMAPSEYLFIRNVSMIYSSLFYASHFLEEWYQEVQKNKNMRFTYCHGKCELSHFSGGQEGCFISLEKAHLGYVWEDFLFFYQKHLQELDMISLYHFYQHKYPYRKEEKLFFFFVLSLPPKIDLYPNSFQKCQELVSFYDEIKLTEEFLSEQEEIKKKKENR